MSDGFARASGLARHDDRELPSRIARSVAAVDGSPSRAVDVERWFKDLGHRFPNQVERISLDALKEWSTHPGSGNIVHRTGRFFTVEGLDVHIPQGPVPRWNQPIINQSEVGILGILAREFDGVLHFLMQAKFEPGNINGFQLSPTVQATRSNYTGVHRGRAVPYVEYFADTSRHHVIADVRQSEQGSWFHHKRNRNMVVEADDVEARDGFCWLTLRQLHRLFAVDDLINADARTVLSCLPFAGPGLEAVLGPRGDRFGSALVRSCGAEGGSLHRLDDILSWITEARTRTEVQVSRIPLRQVRGWHRTEEMIRHESGRYFGVIGVDVTAEGREIGRWTQPMIEPYGTGVIAFLVREIAGTLHALVNIRMEPGYVDVLELAPTVQCTPRNYADLPPAAQPVFLDEVLGARPDQMRFDTVLSEEGGRFYHARNRHLIVEADVDFDVDHPDFRWMTLHQLVELLRHSHYLNVQARSLIACLYSLSGMSATPGAEGVDLS